MASLIDQSGYPSTGLRSADHSMKDAFELPARQQKAGRKRRETLHACLVRAVEHGHPDRSRRPERGAELASKSVATDYAANADNPPPLKAVAPVMHNNISENPRVA